MTHSYHLCLIVHMQFTGDEKRWRNHRNRCDMHCIVSLKSWYKHQWLLFNMVGRHLWPVPPTQHLCVCVEMWPCVFGSTWCFIVLQGAVFLTGEVKYSSDPVNTFKLPNPTVKRLFKLARDAVNKSIYCSERLSICNDFSVHVRSIAVLNVSLTPESVMKLNHDCMMFLSLSRDVWTCIRSIS